MRVSNLSKYCQDVSPLTEGTLRLGEIYLHRKTRVAGVVTHILGGGRVLLDRGGCCDVADLRLATLAEIRKYRAELVAELEPHRFYLLDLLYRDASNYKTFFTWSVDPRLFPMVELYCTDDELTMGELGTPSEDDFFNSETHPYPYDNEDDHNLLTITAIHTTNFMYENPVTLNAEDEARIKPITV